MKNLMKKSAGMLMVAVCLMGTPVFANTDGQGAQEIIEIQPYKAIDVIGGIPDYIQGPDREDLEAMLESIDEHNAAGLHDQANAIWESVYSLMSPYKEQFGSNTQDTEESKSDEELIGEHIKKMEETILRYEGAGDFESADELRADLENFLLEIFGEQDDEMEPHDPDMMHEDPDFMNGDPDLMNDGHDIGYEDPDMFKSGFENDFGADLTPDDVKMIIERLEAEIELLKGYGAGQKLISVEDVLDKVGHELSSEKQEIISYLVDQINKLVAE